MKQLVNIIIAILIVVALPTQAAGASTRPAIADSWFGSAIIGAAETLQPAAAQGLVDDCAPVVKEVIVQCHVSWASFPATVRVYRLTYAGTALAVVYDPRGGWYTIRYRTCAMLGGYNGQSFKQFCHY